VLLRGGEIDNEKERRDIINHYGKGSGRIQLMSEGRRCGGDEPAAQKRPVMAPKGEGGRRKVQLSYNWPLGGNVNDPPVIRNISRDRTEANASGEEGRRDLEKNQ